MNLTRLASSFERDGYVVCEGFFDAEALRDVESEIRRIEADVPGTPGPREYARLFETRVGLTVTTRLESVCSLFDSARMRAATQALLGPGFRAPTSFAFSTPQGCGQGWHQDSAATGPDEFVLNRLVYTRDLDPDCGLLYVLPRSHRLSRLPPGGNHDDIIGQIAMAPRAGTVAFISSRCAHRVGLNASTVVRTSLNSRAFSPTVDPAICDLARFRSGEWRHSSQEFFPHDRERVP